MPLLLREIARYFGAASHHSGRFRQLPLAVSVSLPPFCVREIICNTGGYPFFNQKTFAPVSAVFHLHVRMCFNLTLSPLRVCASECSLPCFLNVVFLRMQAASVVAVNVPSWDEKINHISYSAQKILWNKLCLDHVWCVKYFSTTHQVFCTSVYR